MLTSNLAKVSSLKVGFNILQFRNGHTIRGKRPGVARTLKQRIEEDEKAANPHPLPRVNIGFACKTPSRSQTLRQRIDHIRKNRNDANMEKLSRSQNLVIDLELVRKDSMDTSAPFLVKNIADHYGIYRDLFDNAYFVPRINLDIFFEDDSNTKYPVHHGNIISASSCKTEPSINFDVEKMLLDREIQQSTISYWSILMVSPDTHLFKEANETCLNWFISNIPDGNVKKGDENLKYLTPFPVKGLGYQRTIFVLFRQKQQLDFSKIIINSDDLSHRKFNLLNFYELHQNDITPVGLSFFQSTWDESVTEFFHSRNLKEPVFSYDFPKPYMANQKWFPLRQPFNLYMDKHRFEPSKVNKEYLRSFLFKDLDIPVKYSMAHPIKGVPSWMVSEIKKERLKLIKQTENS